MSKKVLIVDIGNTATEFAVFDGENLQEFLGFFSISKELENVKKELKSLKNKGFSLDDAMIFSVVPNNNDPVKKAIKETLDIDAKIFDWKNYKLKNKNAVIKEAIGADLLADIKQAEKEYGGPCIVADFGTVTKLMLLDEKGSFEGLSFIPGIEISLKLFSQNTALLPESGALNAPKDRLGLNTVESMNHGVYWSNVYYVKDVLNSVKYKNCKLIITGGNSRFVKDEFPNAIIDTKLTLKGMHVLYEEVSK